MDTEHPILNMIVMSIYDDDFAATVLKALHDAGVEPQLIPAYKMPSDQIPEWVSDKGRGALAYISVPPAQFELAVSTIGRLHK